MDKNLYDIMQKLKESKAADDVSYVGTISIEKKTPNGDVLVSKDVLAIVDTLPNGSIIFKYYDEKQTLIAGRGLDGELFPGENYRYDDLAFLSEIDNFDESQAISLNELDNELSEVSKVLGISRDKILSLSQTELDKVIGDEENPEIDLDNDSFLNLSNEEMSKQNDIALDNINSKQEIDLNKKIDDKLTLADVFGVPADSKLIVVYSDQIKDNSNTTRFSCIIKGADGSLEPASMLNQVGGKDSSKNIYESNRDGSKVDNKSVQSSYSIDSPLIKDAILTIRIGQMGTIEVGYGQMDKTSHNDAITQKLETRELYPVKSNVRNEFSQNKGTDNISNKMDEIKYHEDNDCKSMSMKEADGNFSTGHVHSDNVVELILSDDEVRSHY